MPAFCLETTEEPTSVAVPDSQQCSHIGVTEGIGARLRAGVLAFVRDIVLLYRLLRHKNTPWYVRSMLFLPVMYLCSPIQLIPNFIPVIGQLDDVFLIWVTKKLVRKFVDEKTWQECEDAAAATERRLSLGGKTAKECVSV